MSDVWECQCDLVNIKFKQYLYYEYDRANKNGTHLSSRGPLDSPCPRLSRWSTKTDPWLSFEAPGAKMSHIAQMRSIF